MKRIITTTVKEEYAPGKFSAPIHVFQAAGEETLTSPIITFKVYDVQNKLIKRDKVDPNKVISETVFFDSVKKDVPVPDSAGGNACGRTFPSWEGRKFTMAERQEQSKIANYYTYLIGEVTFPGSAPVLANFRMPASIVKEWYGFQNKLGKDRKLWPTFLIQLEAKPQEREQFTAVIFSVKDSNLTLEDTQPVLDTINTFVQEHNNNILNKA